MIMQVYVAVNIFISGNFCFSFVSKSLAIAYITIPKNNGKIKINWDKKLTTTYIHVAAVTGGGVGGPEGVAVKCLWGTEKPVGERNEEMKKIGEGFKRNSK